MREIIAEPLLLLTLGLIGGFFLSIYLIQIILQTLSIKRFKTKTAPIVAELPSLTLLMPVRNEAAIVVEAINRALQLPLEKFEIIVIENASTDKTYDLLHQIFQLRPNGSPETFYSPLYKNLRVMKSPTPGKANALNLALPQVKSEIVATLDADTIPEAPGLIRLLQEFAQKPHVMALGGIVRVIKSSENFLAKIKVPNNILSSLQNLEYLRAFSGERLGWGLLKANIYMSGSCALFRTQSLINKGGFQRHSVTEDLETTLEILRDASNKSHPIDILPIIVAWTQVPHDLKSLLHQRRRWQAGLCQCLWKYHSLILSSRHGLIGVFTIPYIIAAEIWTPLLEFLAILLVAHALFYNIIDPVPVILIATISLLLSGILVTLAAFTENRYLKPTSPWSLVRTFFLSFPLNILYRPIINLVRLEATLRWPWIHHWRSIARKEISS
jgi:cellulose synthase/poly-beta-1,6-N-acetylglucosamine synthase-like glycosyltransferase